MTLPRLYRPKMIKTWKWLVQRLVNVLRCFAGKLVGLGSNPHELFSSTIVISGCTVLWLHPPLPIPPSASPRFPPAHAFAPLPLLIHESLQWWECNKCPTLSFRYVLGLSPCKGAWSLTFFKITFCSPFSIWSWHNHHFDYSTTGMNHLCVFHASGFSEGEWDLVNACHDLSSCMLCTWCKTGTATMSAQMLTCRNGHTVRFFTLSHPGVELTPLDLEASTSAMQAA